MNVTFGPELCEALAAKLFPESRRTVTKVELLAISTDDPGHIAVFLKGAPSILLTNAEALELAAMIAGAAPHPDRAEAREVGTEVPFSVSLE